MSELSVTRLSELKRIALAATQGAWEIRPGNGGEDIGIWSDDTEVLGCSEWLRYNDTDMKHLVTFNPQTVLALIAAIEKAWELSA